jgi:hypothetical protein
MKTVFYKNQMWVLSKSRFYIKVEVEILTDAGVRTYQYNIPITQAAEFADNILLIQRKLEGGLANYWLIRNKFDFALNIVEAYFELWQ